MSGSTTGLDQPTMTFIDSGDVAVPGGFERMISVDTATTPDGVIPQIDVGVSATSDTPAPLALAAALSVDPAESTTPVIPDPGTEAPVVIAAADFWPGGLPGDWAGVPSLPEDPESTTPVVLGSGSDGPIDLGAPADFGSLFPGWSTGF